MFHPVTQRFYAQGTAWLDVWGLCTAAVAASTTEQCHSPPMPGPPRLAPKDPQAAGERKFHCHYLPLLLVAI